MVNNLHNDTIMSFHPILPWKFPFHGISKIFHGISMIFLMYFHGIYTAIFMVFSWTFRSIPMVFPSNFHVVSITFHDTYMALQRLLYVGCLCFKGIVETYINSRTRIFSEFMYVSTIPLKHKLT